MIPYQPLVTVTVSPGNLRGNVFLLLFVTCATNSGCVNAQMLRLVLRIPLQRSPLVLVSSYVLLLPLL